MKIFASLALAIAPLLLAGCGHSDSSSTGSTTNTTSASSVATAPVQYVANAVNAEKKMMKTIDLTSLNHEVDLFNTQEGRYPKSLDELVSMHYLGALPQPPYGSRLDYDPAAGKVSLVNTNTP